MDITSATNTCVDTKYCEIEITKNIEIMFLKNSSVEDKNDHKIRNNVIEIMIVLVHLQYPNRVDACRSQKMIITPHKYI